MIYSTKSGAKRIFHLADVPTPTAAYDIYHHWDFLLSLAKLILHNLHVSTWIFKIDNEFNGRGHASLNVDGIKIVVDLRKKPIEITEKLTERVIEILDKALPNKAKIAMPHLYWNWEEYLKNFLQHGGVIEATPVCLPN